MTMTPTRGEQLIDLAAAINELTRPRKSTELLEETVTRTVVSRSGKLRAKRTRERRRHTVTFPALLDELRDAARPGSAETGISLGGFESRPAAELEPLSVLREITDDAGFWARAFNIDRDDLAATLQALISAPADLDQLELITRQANRWLHRARRATGHEPTPRTLADPCPYCLRRNSLIIAGDLRSAKCSRCGTRWSPDTIGLLADMLRTNETQETVADVRCWMADCTRRGVHDLHQDQRGRSWSRDDRCVDSGHARLTPT